MTARDGLVLLPRVRSTLRVTRTRWRSRRVVREKLDPDRVFLNGSLERWFNPAAAARRAPMGEAA